MALDFPNTPVDGQIFTSGGQTWAYSLASNAWQARATPFPYWDDLLGVANDLPFNLTPAVNLAAGSLQWDAAGECLAYGVEGGDISIGKENFQYFTNLSGVTMVPGDAVSIIPASGLRQGVTLTNATNVAHCRAFVGVVTEGANHNGKVRVTTFGEVHSLTTTGLTEGGPLFVNPALPGKWTQTEPSAPNGVVTIGTLAVAHNGQGVIYVLPRYTPRLQDLSDVNGTALTVDGQLMVWNNGGEYWDATSKVSDFSPAAGGSGIVTTGTVTVGTWNAPIGALATFVSPSVSATALGLGTTNAVTHQRLTITGGSIAVSAPNTITQTWTTTGTYEALAVNVTDSGTANAASTLLDLKVGGVSTFRARKDGTLIVGNGPNIKNYGGHLALNTSQAWVIVDTLTFTTSTDTFLSRDGAGILALKYSTSPHTFRVYNTFTARGSGTTNLEALELKGQAAGSFIIQSMKGSAGGTARDLEIRHGAIDTNGVVANGTLLATFGAAGTTFAAPIICPSASFSDQFPVIQAGTALTNSQKVLFFQLNGGSATNNYFEFGNTDQTGAYTNFGRWNKSGLNLFIGGVSIPTGGSFTGSYFTGANNANVSFWSQGTGGLYLVPGTGFVEINNGTAGAFRDLKLRDLIVDGAASFTTPSTTRTNLGLGITDNPVFGTVTAGNITTTGGVSASVRAVGTSGSLLTTDYTVVVTAVSAQTLPTAVGATGRTYNIKNLSGGSITLAAFGAETIDGATTFTVDPLSNVCVQAYNSSWIVL